MYNFLLNFQLGLIVCEKQTVVFSLIFFFSRGNHRERDWERAQARTGGKGKGKDDDLTPEQRRERYKFINFSGF